MIISKLEIEGLYKITPLPKRDHRGFFMRTYDEDIFGRSGLQRQWVQENHSFTAKAGTIRGLHLQLAPFEETKFVRCTRGSIYDVAVDLRTNSPAFGRWIAVELSEENMEMIFIPRGFAHGFCTLSDDCEVLYKTDNYYSPEYERGIIYCDNDLKVQWPVTDPILSLKDKNNKTLKEFLEDIK
jgi:dTDP-4-dehydrorhamnose 3,5-epimerase